MSRCAEFAGHDGDLTLAVERLRYPLAEDTSGRDVVRPDIHAARAVGRIIVVGENLHARVGRLLLHRRQTSLR